MGVKKNKNKQVFIPQEKDDGSRWNVIDEKGNIIYHGSGTTKRDATRLAEGLIQKAYIKQV